MTLGTIRITYNVADLEGLAKVFEERAHLSRVQSQRSETENMRVCHEREAGVWKDAARIVRHTRFTDDPNQEQA